MPNSKPTSNDLAMTWLESQSRSDDIFASINASQAIKIIREQKRKLASLGAAFNNVRSQRDKAWEALEEARKGLKTQSERDSEQHGYFCDHCKIFVPSEVIRTTESFDDPIPNVRSLYIRICLRCGNQIFDRGLIEEQAQKEEEDAI